MFKIDGQERAAFTIYIIRNFSTSIIIAIPVYPAGTLTIRSRQKKKGNQVDPDKVMDGLEKELNFALKAMSKTKDINEKEAYSRIIKNLCESQGVFLKLASEVMPFDFDDDIDGDVIPF